MTRTAPARPATATDAPQHSALVSILVDVVAPIVIFYVLRGLGVDQVLALLAGAVAPAVRTVYVVVRHRTLDAIGALTLSVIALTVVTSLITGDARFALARDGVITAVVGVWILATLALARPFIYTFSTAFMGAAERASWEECWGRSSRFRHGMKVHTVIWGIGMIVDSAIRVIMAYTLPVDSVPLLNGIQYAVLLVALFAISFAYSRATGLVPGSPHYPAKPKRS